VTDMLASRPRLAEYMKVAAGHRSNGELLLGRSGMLSWALSAAARYRVTDPQMSAGRREP
jgi:hypothetical protein